MGGGVSQPQGDDIDKEVVEIGIKGLPEAIEQAIFVHERYPVIIDPTGKARMFLKYQLGSYIRHKEFSQTNLNRSLAGALLHGKTLTVAFEDLNGISYEFFEPGYFPKEVLNRAELYKDGVWQTIFKPEEGDPCIEDITPSPEFVFVLCTASDFVPAELFEYMRVIKVVDQDNKSDDQADNELEQIAGLYGATEVIRNSTAVVEAGFDGDIEELSSLVEKGYHIESRDGRKHTALSEAACQGHIPMIQHLISQGADPNTANDTGRTPVWRSCFNGHMEAVKVLLEAGGDPDCRDNTSMETAYDVAKTDEIRELIGGWDRSITEKLKEKRRQEIQASAEARIRTSAEREELARQKLRCEAVELATAKDLPGLKEFFNTIVSEAEQTSTKPRLTVECRNNTGQSLLSIATQNNDVPMVEFLLTHWKTCDMDRWDLSEGEMSVEAKVYKTNPNSRDLKGWSCACIAVFHDSRAALALLLEHGADPNLRSSYNKNAWDLAKDELDAAEKVVRSRKEIRQVLIDHDNSSATLFGRSSSQQAKECNMYKDLGEDGSPIVMQQEMEKEMQGSTSKPASNKGKGKPTKKDGKKESSVSKKKKGGKK
mmetsp:Transcript_10710/g.16229  ORF Transcript_10710/g.16229 Transcript_10710/m.16229 type:complete len:598 (-) Transcript_10710:423-2216(-)|eukprot:CAMPEP_0185035088 /NCGR_PEP_ID=MMETSP1103-20130426/25800_1 /TAXON_ID=36769 /ORGANISM="Paraphysomonas bandaiensis, Strain Caron Lab Isolate" /LENGTH=597 /DNA_ID=CAMNT_0027572003 /DNA_START=58 /DNA_END=1851 /DNA_ORIENTATION=+